MAQLILEEIELHDFKNFVGTHKFRLNRGPGLFYIAGKNSLDPQMGANGVGKTSLWDCPFWVLYNKTGRDPVPANEVVPLDKEDGTPKGTLYFSRDGESHTISRSRKPNTFFYDSRAIKQTDVSNIFGLSEEMFRRTIILPQFEHLFLDLRAEQQTSLFNDALSLGVYLKAAKLASQKALDLAKLKNAVLMEISKLEGRKTELQQSLVQEREARDDFADQLHQKKTEVGKQITSVKQEFWKHLKQVPSSETASLQALEGFDAIERGVSGATRLKTELDRDLTCIEKERSASERELLSGKQKLVSYEKALTKDQTCPECGQKTPVSHIKEKIKIFKAGIANLEKDLESSEQGQLELESSLKQISNALLKLRPLRDELSDLYREQRRLEDGGNPHKQNVDDLKARIQKADTQLKQATHGLSLQENEIGICDYWTDAFKEIRLQLIDEVLEELELVVTRHAESLGLVDWNIKFQTERVSQAGNVSSFFNVMLFPPGRRALKFESYSGGESQRWQLAVSFGLSEVILSRAGVSPNIEVYDEPSIRMSPEGIESFLEHLRNRAKELDKSIYVIEQHALDSGMFDGVITIEKTTKGSFIHE